MSRTDLPSLDQLAAAICEVDPRQPGASVCMPLHPWRGITFHHSFIPVSPVWRVDYARAFNQFHWRKRRWEYGLGYHFVVTWDPAALSRHRWQASYRWVHQLPGAHARNLLGTQVEGRVVDPNRQTIGICLVGNFERQAPRPESYGALAQLVRPLRKAFDIPAEWLFRHDNFAVKACPGKLFDVNAVIAQMGE